MIILPKQLQDRKFRFVKVDNDKRPVEKKWAEENNYRYNDPEFKAYLKHAEGYGVVCGYANLLIVDIENIDDKSVANLVMNHKFPETFTVQSGGGGWHLYYFVSGVNKRIRLAKDGKHYGEIQSKANQCIGPGSLHPSGKVYSVLNTSGIKTIEKDLLLKILDGFIEEEKEKTNFIPTTGGGLNWDISELLKYCPGLRNKDEVKYSGPHPVHGSTTGQNFEIDVDKNTWYCFRCGIGGDAVSLIAMLENLVQVDEFCPSKEKFKEVFRKVKEIGIKKYGYPDDNYKAPVKPKMEEPPIFVYAGNKKKLNTKELAEYFRKQYSSITMESVTGKGAHIYVYRDGYYKLNGQSILETFIKSLFTKQGKLWTSHYENEIVRYVKTFDAQSRKEFQTDPNLINFNNGTYDLKTKRLRTWKAEDHFLYKIPWDYKPKMKLSRHMTKYFKTTFKNKEEHIALIQELLGYCLYSKYNYHGLFYLYGTGGNGKTVFVTVLEKLLGQDNVSNKSVNSLVRVRFATSHLYGKLVNSCGELSGKVLEETDMLKRLTAGDKIEAEFKGLDGFDFPNIAKIITACNSIPQSYDDSDGWYERQFIVPFTQKFRYTKQEDNELAEKLMVKKNMESLLVWALEGLHRLLQNKAFTYPRDKKQLYLMYQGNTKYFVNKFYTRSENMNDYIKVDDIRADYETWCKENDVPIASDESLAGAFRYYKSKMPVDIRLISIDNKKVYVRYGLRKVK